MVTYSAPDNASAVALTLAASAAGHLKTVKTTTLLTPEEFLDASRKAGGAGYQAPSRT